MKTVSYWKASSRMKINGRTKSLGFLLGGFLICVAGFQNCGRGFQSSGLASSTSSVGLKILNADSPQCNFNGQRVPEGGAITAFLTSTVPSGQACVSETRTCTDSQLGGSFTFASCNVGGKAACLINGQTIPSGASVTAYQDASVPFGNVCVSQTRTCDNGALSGTYQYGDCAPASSAPASCLFNGQTIASGSVITAYDYSAVDVGQTCTSQVRTCTNGVLSGNARYGSCVVNQPQACLFNGLTIPSGGTVLGYQSAGVPYGQKCIAETRTCTNGALSGSLSNVACDVSIPGVVPDKAVGDVQVIDKATTCPGGWDLAIKFAGGVFCTKPYALGDTSVVLDVRIRDSRETACLDNYIHVGDMHTFSSKGTVLAAYPLCVSYQTLAHANTFFMSLYEGKTGCGNDRQILGFAQPGVAPDKSDSYCTNIR